MKLSTRSRYGTRLMLDMAQHYREGPLQLGDIAKRQGSFREVFGTDHHSFEKSPLH